MIALGTHTNYKELDHWKKDLLIRSLRVIQPSTVYSDFKPGWNLDIAEAAADTGIKLAGLYFYKKDTPHNTHTLSDTIRHRITFSVEFTELELYLDWIGKYIDVAFVYLPPTDPVLRYLSMHNIHYFNKFEEFNYNDR